MIPISLVAEDILSEAVLRRIMADSGKTFVVNTVYSNGGFGYIKKKILGFNQAAKGIPFLVLTDLDTEVCAPTLIKNWMGDNPLSKYMIFRIAVKEVEAWLLADDKNFSKFLSSSVVHFPADPELEIDPKQTLINIARKSKNKKLMERIVPLPNSGASQGPDYNGALIDFVVNHWDLGAAMAKSSSLVRAYNKICSFQFP